MTTLIIARHGNTFATGETPKRVGLCTDISLVDSGRTQAYKLGKRLLEDDLLPNVVYCSELKRTQETAQGVLNAMQITTHLLPLAQFNEIDYGVDENKTEDEVIARIGQTAIDDWNRDCVVPDGWHVNPGAIKTAWQQFANACTERHKDQVILVVTSNGVARFAPAVLPSEDLFDQHYARKLATGAYGIFVFSKNMWQVQDWNVKP